MMIARNLLPLSLVALGGCPDAPGWETFPPPGLSATDTAPPTSLTLDDPEPTTSGEIVTTTIDPTSTSMQDDTMTETTATLEPAILEPVVLTPNPIESNGLISVAVNTNPHADGVRMQLDSGDEIELDMIEPSKFSGSIPAFTGLDNGDHVALLTPWGDAVDGETVPASYTIALPEPGSQGFWETGDLIGAGYVAAMGVLPGGDVIEFGTLTTGDGPRCYMRRRDKGGAWLLTDVVKILPDIECVALDLVVDAQGVMFVLAERDVGNDMRWWLARISAWKAEPAQVGIGSKDQTAVALAAHPSGPIAACGYEPTPALDDDAFAVLFRPNLPGETRTFDYRPDIQKSHQFWERTRDCTFAGDTLVLVGEAHGWHGMEVKGRDRLFILRLDMDAPTSGAWNVAQAGIKMHSGAQAVAVDNLGRLVVAGFTCDDDCTPEGDLRIYDLEDDLASLTSLGTFPSKQFVVQDLAWSPANYAVVATGGIQGNESAFTVRAFDSAKVDPVWTFTREDGGVLHFALALAIGKYGEVYAGGLGETGYPAVAYIGG